MILKLLDARKYLHLHRWTLLLADAIVVEVLARQTVGLGRTGTTAGTEQMATFPRFRPKTASLRALRRTVQLAKPLTVVCALSPASHLTGRMTRRAHPFGRRKVKRILHARLRCRQYLLPVDRLHVAQIVVVEEPDRPAENVAQCRQLQRVHVRERHKQPVRFLPLVQLEGGPAADDLQPGQYHLRQIDMADQHVPGHLADVLEKVQIGDVLDPGDLQIAVHVRAVGVAVAQIFVMILAVRRHRHPPIRTDAYCGEKRKRKEGAR